MKYLILFTALFLFGCATFEEKVVYEPPVLVEEQGFPEGEITYPPFGYIKHCIDYPDSIFCE